MRILVIFAEPTDDPPTTNEPGTGEREVGL